MKIEKKRVKIFVIILILGIVGLLFYYSYFNKTLDNFSVNSFLIKSVIKQGEYSSQETLIVNNGNDTDFNVVLNNLEGLVSVSENSFRLNSGESKKLELIFSDELLSIEPGIYTGSLIVETSAQKKSVPIIFEVQTRVSFFAINLEISPSYLEVNPGKRFSSEIKIFNLNDTKMHPISISYSIRNFEGGVVLSEEENNFVVGSESSTIKTILLPEDIALGKYVFTVVIDYGDTVNTASGLFSVVDNKIINGGSNLGLDVNLFIIIIFTFLFGIIVLIVYLIHDRNQLFLELRKQQNTQLRDYKQNIEKQKNLKLSKVKDKIEKRKICKEFSKIKKAVVRGLKKKQKRQIIEFKVLRKKKKKSAMRQKIDEWGKEGFNVNELIAISGKKLKVDKKTQIDKWKKMGFDTSVFNS